MSTNLHVAVVLQGSMGRFGGERCVFLRQAGPSGEICLSGWSVSQFGGFVITLIEQNASAWCR